CLKAMAKRPEDRYPSCKELAEDLRLWLKDEPIRARRLGLGERARRWLRREPRLAAALAVALGCLVLVAVVLAVSARQSSDTAKREQQLHQVADTLRIKADEARGEADADREKVTAMNKELEKTVKEKGDALNKLTEQAAVLDAETKKAIVARDKEIIAL